MQMPSCPECMQMLPKSNRPRWRARFGRPLQAGLFGTPWSDRVQGPINRERDNIASSEAACNIISSLFSRPGSAQAHAKWRGGRRPSAFAPLIDNRFPLQYNGGRAWASGNRSPKGRVSFAKVVFRLLGARTRGALSGDFRRFCFARGPWACHPTSRKSEGEPCRKPFAKSSRCC